MRLTHLKYYTHLKFYIIILKYAHTLYIGLPRTVSGWSGSWSRAKSVDDVVVFVVSNTVTTLSLVVAASVVYHLTNTIHYCVWF